MVLVYTSSPEGQLKKSAFEAVTYGYKAAQVLGTEVVALTIGNVDNAGVLGQYGAAKVLNAAGAEKWSQIFARYQRRFCGEKERIFRQSHR